MRSVVYAVLLVYFLLIHASLLLDGTGAAVFNLGVLLVLSVAAFVFRDDEYSWPLIATTLLFILPAAAGLFFDYTMESSVLGEDKLFHAAGGAVLAWFAAIAVRPHIKVQLLYFIAVVSIACAIGAWWEVYEWVLLELKNGSVRLTLTDSLLDIVADTLGAAIVAFVYVKKGKNKGKV